MRMTGRQLTVNNSVEHFKRIEVTEAALGTNHGEKEVAAHRVGDGLPNGKLHPHSLYQSFFTV